MQPAGGAQGLFSFYHTILLISLKNTLSLAFIVFGVLENEMIESSFHIEAVKVLREDHF